MAIVIFIILNLINVVLQTLKSILTIKSTPNVASLINAMTFGFYVIVIKELANFDMVTTVIITIIANLIGVQIATFLVSKFTKDQLWKITVVSDNIFDTEYIKNKLQSADIGFVAISVNGNGTVIDIYSYDHLQTETIQTILNKTKAKRHYVPVHVI